MRREEEEDGKGLEDPGPAGGWRPLSRGADTGTMVEDIDTAAQNGLAQWKEGDEDRKDTDTESLVDTGQQKNWDPRTERRSTGVAVDTVPDDWGR